MVLFSPVRPVRAEAPTVGLVTSARTPDDPNDVRWQGGFSWRPERCFRGSGYNPCSDNPALVDLGGTDSELAYYVPNVLRVEDVCSTMSPQAADDRVLRQLEAATPYAVARELWTGELSDAAPYDTPNGANQVNARLASQDAVVITPGNLGPHEAIGALEESARAAALGQQVYIHVPLRVFAMLGDHVTRRGQLWYTGADSIVVPDAGYSGVGPMTPGTSEVQTVTITGGPTGGTFTLTYSGQTTASIAYDASAADVQSALEALPNLAPGDVTVTGTGPYTVTFRAALGDVDQMTADGSELTGGADPDVVVATTTPGVAPAVTPGLWVYATGPVTVRLGQPQVLTDPMQVVDRSTNTRTNIAERVFAATFDPCVHFGVTVSLPGDLTP
jgi:hypothetical protein